MNAIWCHFLAEILREDFHRLVVHRLVGRVLNGGKKVHQIVFHGRNGIDVKIPSGTSTLIGWLNVFWWPLEARDLSLRFDWSGHKPENCLSDNNLEDFFFLLFCASVGYRVISLFGPLTTASRVDTVICAHCPLK